MVQIQSVYIDGSNQGTMRLIPNTNIPAFFAESINGQSVSFEGSEDTGLLFIQFKPSGNVYKLDFSEPVLLNDAEFTNPLDFYSNVADFFKKGGSGTGTTLNAVLAAGNIATDTPEYFLTQDQDTFNQSPTAAVYTDTGTGRSITITRDNQTRNGNVHNATVTMPRRSGIVQLENERPVNLGVQLGAGDYSPDVPGLYVCVNTSPGNKIALETSNSALNNAPVGSRWNFVNATAQTCDFDAVSPATLITSTNSFNIFLSIVKIGAGEYVAISD